ncbi:MULTISPECIES: hypothetical protein [Vibrio]|uniref:Uncharacterized protein n=1 Tax=Vibrio kanaloae TaxID=170673 RepID=A0A0H3ZYD2_9VIBR|nr:hypothetical protein [Vibrio kanaloae]AKN35690.1 hypothetical protein [Vibrio kanaloae]AKN37390.1 hypothetical protein [Vibrio kanaloae]AKN37798.1 hypothetical protein [Vibrio kanaloae]AKN38884.1 hypothetical protein [Vibrio kanaloae]AKN40126.1 hypothetical protein [Vibrio kanaloae]
MSSWRTLGDGRKVMVQEAGPSESFSSISKSLKNPESLIKMSFRNNGGQGKLFPTLCFWCKAPVYFVENSSNGGCFLADRTASEGGWKVHACWLANKGIDKSLVIKHYREKIKEKKLLTSPKNTKKKKQIFDYELIKKVRKLHLYSSHKKPLKLFVASFELIEVNKQILINQKNYQVVQFRDRGHVIRALIQSESFPSGVLARSNCLLSLKFKRSGKAKIPFISEIRIQGCIDIEIPKKIRSFEINEIEY